MKRAAAKPVAVTPVAVKPVAVTPVAVKPAAAKPVAAKSVGQIKDAGAESMVTQWMSPSEIAVTAAAKAAEAGPKTREAPDPVWLSI